MIRLHNIGVLSCSMPFLLGIQFMLFCSCLIALFSVAEASLLCLLCLWFMLNLCGLVQKEMNPTVWVSSFLSVFRFFILYRV